MTDDRSTAPLPPPTPELRSLARVLGRERLLRLLERRGGTRLPVPVKVAGTLVDDLGADLVAALVDGWGGERLKVPLGRAWLIQVYHARGMSYGEIASRLRLTEDGVWRSLRTAGLTAAAPAADAASTAAADDAEPAAGPAQLDILAWLGEDR